MPGTGPGIGEGALVGTRAASVPSFEDVYREHRGEVVRLAYVLVRSAGTAEELAHDAFIRLHLHFDEIENPAGFLHTAVIRLSLTWLSRATKERELLARLDVPASFEPSPVDEMWAALGRLPA